MGKTGLIYVSFPTVYILQWWRFNSERIGNAFRVFSCSEYFLVQRVMMHHNLAKFRRFALYRYEDESGISGTGVIAEGIQFSSGGCVLAWITETPSINIYENIDEIMLIHGHQGKTEIRWIDPES